MSFTNLPIKSLAASKMGNGMESSGRSTKRLFNYPVFCHISSIIFQRTSFQRVDIGVVGFGTSHSREKAVDFGISFLPGGVRMATKMKAVETNPFFFLKPFSNTVWYATTWYYNILWKNFWSWQMWRSSQNHPISPRFAIIAGIIFFFVAIHVLDWYSPYGFAGIKSSNLFIYNSLC